MANLIDSNELMYSINTDRSNLCIKQPANSITIPISNYIDDRLNSIDKLINQIISGEYAFLNTDNNNVDKKENNNMKNYNFYTSDGYRINKTNNTKIPTMITVVTLNDDVIGRAVCDAVDYDQRQGILEAIANSVCDGNFEKVYNKMVKKKAADNKKMCTCSCCGTVFDNPEEARCCEQNHIENKKLRNQRRLERKEARRRLEEAEREKRIRKYMTDMQ